MDPQKIEEKKLYIKKGEHLSYNSGEFQICCMSGIIWVTWPGSGDVILREGEKISINNKGILCITAFECSTVSIEDNKLSLNFTGDFKLFSRKRIIASASTIKKRGLTGSF